jgi:MSHA biogenesis protein MshP
VSLRARPLQGRGRRRQNGFSLVAAVFLIVVLAALGTFAVQVAMSQYQSGNVHLLERRAQAAADAGVGYAASLALSPAGTCRPNRTLRLTQATLAGFVIKLTCVRTTHQIQSLTPPSPRTYYAYALSSTALYGTYGQPDYVARTVTRTVTNAPP